MQREPSITNRSIWGEVKLTITVFKYRGAARVEEHRGPTDVRGSVSQNKPWDSESSSPLPSLADDEDFLVYLTRFR